MSTTISANGDVIRIQNLKNIIERGKTEKARAEATLESLKKQEEQLLAQVRELGVDPDHLEEEIAKLSAEISQLLDQAEALLKG